MDESEYVNLTKTYFARNSAGSSGGYGFFSSGNIIVKNSKAYNNHVSSRAAVSSIGN